MRPAELIGSGPFKLKQYKPGQFTLVERNPHYWQVDANGKRLPYFDNVVMSIVPDQNAMGLRFMKGEADLLEFVRPEEADTLKQPPIAANSVSSISASRHKSTSSSSTKTPTRIPGQASHT